MAGGKGRGQNVRLSRPADRNAKTVSNATKKPTWIPKAKDKAIINAQNSKSVACH